MDFEIKVFTFQNEKSFLAYGDVVERIVDYLPNNVYFENRFEGVSIFTGDGIHYGNIKPCYPTKEKIDQLHIMFNRYEMKRLSRFIVYKWLRQDYIVLSGLVEKYNDGFHIETLENSCYELARKILDINQKDLLRFMKETKKEISGIKKFHFLLDKPETV